MRRENSVNHVAAVQAQIFRDQRADHLRRRGDPERRRSRVLRRGMDAACKKLGKTRPNDRFKHRIEFSGRAGQKHQHLASKPKQLPGRGAVWDSAGRFRAPKDQRALPEVGAAASPDGAPRTWPWMSHSFSLAESEASFRRPVTSRPHVAREIVECRVPSPPAGDHDASDKRQRFAKGLAHHGLKSSWHEALADEWRVRCRGQRFTPR